MRDSSQLSQWLAKIEQGEVIRLGLARCREVAMRLNCLPTIPCVVVGGTNGKGSTVATLAWLLHQSGLSVGSYTSPHLMHYEERIQVNGCPVSAAQIVQAFEAIDCARDNIPLTYFEWTTLAALWLFKNTATCDMLVLEVGLGGRLDAVNIVDATAAIVTSIGHDHQDYLGETLAEIAQEKAGIFREGIPVVLGESACQETLLHQADQLGVSLSIEGQDFDITQASKGQTFHYISKHHPLKLSVPFNDLPKSSLSLALATYTILEKRLKSLRPLSYVIGSVAALAMVGRVFQFSYEGKTIILDAAHNPEGAHWLAKRLEQAGNTQVVAIWSSLQDKPLEKIVMAMKPLVKQWFIGALPAKRAAPVTLLQKHLAQQGIQNTQCHSTIADAFKAALNVEGKTIVVFGSFYSVACILQAIDQFNKPMAFHGLLSTEKGCLPQCLPQEISIHE